MYTVEIITDYITYEPARSYNFKILTPTKYFKASVRLRGDAHHKFKLTMKHFGHYNPSTPSESNIEPNSSFSYFENKGWTLPTAGFCYTVTPIKLEDYWNSRAPEIEDEDI